MFKTNDFINEGYKPKMTEAQAMEFKNATNIADVSEETMEALKNDIQGIFEPITKKISELTNKKIPEQTREILNMYEPSQIDSGSYAIYSSVFAILSTHCEALKTVVIELTKEVENLKKEQPKQKRWYQFWK